MNQSQANQLQRNINSLNSEQLGYLEQYLIINKPTKTLYLLVDKLFEYAYTMDGEPMIPNKDALMLLRNQSSLEPLQSLYLEEWLFYNRPSKRYFALVDKTLSNAYVYADGCTETIEIGSIDSFNCKKNHCYVLGYNDILYYGKLVDIGNHSYYGCEMIANRNQWDLIKDIWRQAG